MKKITLLLLLVTSIVFAQTPIASYTFDNDAEGFTPGKDATVGWDAATHFFTAAGSLILSGPAGRIGKVTFDIDGAGEYTVTYKVKGAVAGQVIRTQFRYNNSVDEFFDDTVDGAEAGGDAAGTWTTISHTFTLDGSASNCQFQPKIKTNDAIYYIDDVTVVKEAVVGSILTVDVVGVGTVGLTIDKLGYEVTDVETLTATAATHWSFDSWSGDVSGSTNPETITMDADKTVTANFVTEPSFDYAFNFASDGDLEGWTLDPKVTVASHTAGEVTLSLEGGQWSRFNLFGFPVPSSTYNKCTVIVKNGEPTTNQLALSVGVSNETKDAVLASQIDFQTIEFDLTQYSDWTGDVDNIRVRFSELDGEFSGRPSVSHDVVISSVVFTFDANLSMGEINKDDASISLYPNPAHDILNISLEADQIEIYNILGQKIICLKNVSSVDTSRLSSGSYIIKLIDNSGATSSKKFLKN